MAETTGTVVGYVVHVMPHENDEVDVRELSTREEVDALIREADHLPVGLEFFTSIRDDQGVVWIEEGYSSSKPATVMYRTQPCQGCQQLAWGSRPSVGTRFHCGCDEEPDYETSGREALYDELYDETCRGTEYERED